MPLNEVARRYADNLFSETFHETARRQAEEIAKMRIAHAANGSIRSGGHIRAEARVLVESIRVTGEAKADGLLRAYAESGSPFDDSACHEVKSEVIEYCSGQQHNAVGAIGQSIRQFIGTQADTNLDKAIVHEIVQGVNEIISHLARKLEIARDQLILTEAKLRRAYAAGLGKRWDVFISHASEDKDFVRPLAEALRQSGLSIWYDEFTLKVGDSLRRKIDEGLAQSRYGIVVLSHLFFAKNWPQSELDGLMSNQIAGNNVILPVWHNLTAKEVQSYSPMLSGLIAAQSGEGMEQVVRKLREAMGL